MAKKKQNKNNVWLWISLTIIAVIVLLLVLPKMFAADGLEVSTSAVKTKDITESIPASGKIQPVIEIKISPDVSGEIVELNVEEGDYVNKGDLILKIKQDTYISLVERAEASLNSVKAQYYQQKAQLMQTELNYNRSKKMFDNQVISESEYETAFTEFQVAKEQLKAADFNVKSGEASLKEARENLIKTTIYAPMSGVVSKLSVEQGERVVGTSQMAGTEMLRIANFDQMEVLVDVNENDIIHINNNDTAKIEVDAYMDRVFSGVVTQIANSAKNIGNSVEQVTNFEVKILILQESYKDLLESNPIPFRPGMSASVSIITNKKANVLTIPLQAVTMRNAGDGVQKSSEDLKQSTFVIKDDNTVKLVQIETGLQDLSDIEIISGVCENDIVVTGPYTAVSKTLKDGSKIIIKKNE